MPTVFSKRLLVVKGLTAEIHAAPPAGTKWVIRDVETYANVGLAGSRFTLMGELEQAILSFVWSPNSTQSFQWQGRIVVEQGTQIGVKADSATDVTISGYELTLP